MNDNNTISEYDKGYTDGYNDGIAAQKKEDILDFNIQLVQALKDVKGIGDKTIEKVYAAVKAHQSGGRVTETEKEHSKDV